MRASQLRITLRAQGVPVETTETRNSGGREVEDSRPLRFWSSERLLSLGPLGLALVQGVCAVAVFLSGIRTALGFSSLIAATAAGPATGLHANRIRIPMLVLAG